MVATSLAHKPHRNAIDGLPATSAIETALRSTMHNAGSTRAGEDMQCKGRATLRSLVCGSKWFNSLKKCKTASARGSRLLMVRRFALTHGSEQLAAAAKVELFRAERF